ncbi:TPA: hypothetical protein ACGEYH_000052 [Providencia rettgeri]
MIMRLIYIILAFEIVFYKFKKVIPRENTLLFIFVMLMSGCTNYRVNTDNINILDNDQLCKALGENLALVLQGFERTDDIKRLNNEIAQRAVTEALDKNKCNDISERTKDYEYSRVRFGSLMNNNFNLINRINL